MSRRLSVGGPSRLIIVVLPAALVALSGVMTQWIRRGAIKTDGALRHSYAVNSQLADVLQRLTDAETTQRGYVLTGDTALWRSWTDAQARAETDLDSLRVLSRAQPLERQRAESLAVLAHSRLDRLAATAPAWRAVLRTAGANITTVGPGRATMDSARALAAVIRRDEESLLRARSDALQRQRDLVTLVVGIGTTVAVLVALFVNGLLTRYALDRERSALRLQTQATQLGTQNTRLQDQADVLEDQRAKLQDQADALEAANRELELTAQELRETAERVSAAGAEAERARTAAEVANRAKSEFLTTMSHELRTPLNAIVGYVQLLQEGVRGPVPREQADDLARIRRAGRHLLGLINDVLNFARLEAGRVTFEHVDVALRDTLTTAAAMLEPQARSRNVSLISRPCDDTVAARGDRDKILQIVVNLLSNAVKFTPQHGRVEVACAAGADAVRVTVSDTGPGIARAHLSRIFEPFVQVGRIPLGTDAGVGLGLAISRDLARGMGGDLTVESTQGRGSTFTLTLPLAGGARAPSGWVGERNSVAFSGDQDFGRSPVAAPEPPA